MTSALDPVPRPLDHLAERGRDDAPALILLHGGLGNADYWANQIPAFAEQFKVIVADSRGHGRSTWDGHPFSYDLMAADTLAVMDALGINDDHVRAYDNIAQRVTDWALAAKQARDVRHLVTENGADMDKLLEAMQLATEAYGIVLEQEIQSYELVADYRQAQWSAELSGDAALTPERRETIATLLRRSELADKEAQQRARKAQRAAAAGVKRVRQAHQAMLENVDRLSSEQVRDLLREAADDLKSIRRSISEL